MSKLLEETKYSVDRREFSAFLVLQKHAGCLGETRNCAGAFEDYKVPKVLIKHIRPHHTGLIFLRSTAQFSQDKLSVIKNNVLSSENHKFEIFLWKYAVLKIP